jgi:hypothetical protein
VASILLLLFRPPFRIANGQNLVTSKKNRLKEIQDQLDLLMDELHRIRHRIDDQESRRRTYPFRLNAGLRPTLRRHYRPRRAVAERKTNSAVTTRDNCAETLLQTVAFWLQGVERVTPRIGRGATTANGHQPWLSWTELLRDSTKRQPS